MVGSEVRVEDDFDSSQKKNEYQFRPLISCEAQTHSFVGLVVQKHYHL